MAPKSCAPSRREKTSHVPGYFRTFHSTLADCRIPPADPAARKFDNGCHRQVANSEFRPACHMASPGSGKRSTAQCSMRRNQDGRINQPLRLAPSLRQQAEVGPASATRISDGMVERGSRVAQPRACAIAMPCTAIFPSSACASIGACMRACSLQVSESAKARFINSIWISVYAKYQEF